MLADPAVFSAPLEATVRAYLEVSSSFRDTPTIEKNLIIHVLQKGLGTACQSSRLAQALEVNKLMMTLWTKGHFSHDKSVALGMTMSVSPV